jgi:hypothetical protein
MESGLETVVAKFANLGRNRILVLGRRRRRGRRVGTRRRKSGRQQAVANLGNQRMAWSSRRGKKEVGRWRRRGR